MGAGGEAAWALGEIGDPAAVMPLIEALGEPFVAGQAVEALVKLGDPRMVEPLISYFSEIGIPSVATVLGNLGDRRVVPVLIAALAAPDPSTRYYAARALGKLGDQRALPALERAYAYDTTPLRVKSVRGKSVSDVAAKAIERIRDNMKMQE
jgi:HEAT repeat protein